MENDKRIIVSVDFDYENDTEVKIYANEILFIHRHEDADVGRECYRHPNGNVEEVAKLLDEHNTAYQNGKYIESNPFSDFTSSATFAWEYALYGIDIGNTKGGNDK